MVVLQMELLKIEHRIGHTIGTNEFTPKNVMQDCLLLKWLIDVISMLFHLILIWHSFR